MLKINEIAPNFVAVTTHGEIDFHDWIEKSWVILFSHPKDFTPVCTTELGYMASIENEFTKRNCKLIGLSIDSVEDHNLWKKDIEDVQGTSVNYPLIADEGLKIAKSYNMLPAEEKADSSRTAMNNATVRSVFLIDPDKKIRMMLTYPMTTGRNFNEIIKFYNNCTKKQIQCENENKLLAFKKFNKYIFVYSNNYNLEEIEGKYFYKKKK